MVILFSPAQGERVAVGVPPHSSTIDLHFSAAFASQEDDHEANRDGVTVELWSNIPGAHRREGRWGAISFDRPTSDSGNGFPIIPGDTSNSKVLHLSITIPISGRNHWEIEYTYRLVYPSGEIKWLGDYERNGVVVFERSDPDFFRGRFFDSRVREGTFSSGEDGWDNKEFMRLSQDVDWSIYAIRQDGSVYMRSLASLNVLMVFFIGHLMYIDWVAIYFQPVSLLHLWCL
jgi:hypothetical protein